MIRGRSAFAQIAPKLAIFYSAVLFLILLFPFTFTSAERENSASWQDPGKGVRFGQSGMLVSAGPPTEIFRQLISGKGLTIELWLRAASSDQDGPARIVSYSINPWERNFSLGQEGNALDMRLRTTTTSANGTPSVEVADVFVAGKMQHVVVTYDFVEERVYVDGELRATSATPRGNFETWDPSFFLVFGNEHSGGRPWDGDIAYAAIYDRALSGKIARSRYKTGYGLIESPAPAGLVTVFNFAKHPNGLDSGGRTAGSALPGLRLVKPASVGESRLFLSFLNGTVVFAEPTLWDIIRNVVLFAPFGMFVFATLEKRVSAPMLPILLTVIGAGLVSATFEILQFFLNMRTSSIFDLGANSAGALVGALGCWIWFSAAGRRGRSRN